MLTDKQQNILASVLVISVLWVCSGLLIAFVVHVVTPEFFIFALAFTTAYRFLIDMVKASIDIWRA
ncbi:MAG TPA: hypothetical protein DCZ12_04145 [Gammaproteobacteria bacterium]|nr:hypothetical protein [Gammaproteobacteria bacterium]